MAQIDKPNLHFNTNLYTGNGSTQHSITGVGFQPDLVWIKGRGSTYSHFWFDAVRGAGKQIYSNSTAIEATNNNNLYSFDSDGFSLAQSGNDDVTNQNNINFASWNWKAANSAGSSNTDGSITSTVSANTTAGFSIVSYTGNGSDGATVGHGLGVTPSCIIFKNRSDVQYWVVYHKELGGANNHLRLDTTAATSTSLNMFSSTAPTSSVFEIGTQPQVNGNTNNIIAYCFAEKKGFSKFGKYTGNGSANGPFVYTGFKPAMVILKNTSTTGNWQIMDNKRNTDNPVDTLLKPNDTIADQTPSDAKDFLSNGFKLRKSATEDNGNANTFIYMAFAENPIVGSNNIAAVAE